MIDCIQIIILSYALGAIPFGVVLAKLFRLPDPRTIGSGNIGATNMLRTGRKDVALLTLLLDGGKGAAAVILARVLMLHASLADPIFAAAQQACSQQASCVMTYYPSPHFTALALLCAAVGHMYSPFLKFKGGKGMATLLGGALAFSWPVGISMLVVWLLVAFIIRYVSVASITALALAPLVTWLRVDGTSAFILAIAGGIAIWRHKDNIYRLRHGMEPKLKLGSKA